MVDLAEILDATANQRILTYYATHSRDPVVLESILRNLECRGADSRLPAAQTALQLSSTC